MSCFGCNKITSAVRTIKGVSKGTLNILIKKDEVEEFANKRIDICNACPELFLYSFIKDKWSVHKCRKCGCVIKLKTRVQEEQCPLDKW